MLTRCGGCYVQDQAPPSALEVVRCIATARIVMPRSVVRLSAGRLNFSLSDQVRAQPLHAWTIMDKAVYALKRIVVPCAAVEH